MRILALLFLILGACAKPSDSGSQPEQFTEFQYQLPYDFKFISNNKTFNIQVQKHAACTGTNCGGIGKWTYFKYSSTFCVVDTRLTQDSKLNFYYLEVRVPSAPEPGYTGIDESQNINPVCNDLIGDYWIHHNGLDYENLYMSEFNDLRNKFGIQMPVDAQGVSARYNYKNVDLFERVK